MRELFWAGFMESARKKCPEIPIFISCFFAGSFVMHHADNHGLEITTRYADHVDAHLVDMMYNRLLKQLLKFFCG